MSLQTELGDRARWPLSLTLDQAPRVASSLHNFRAGSRCSVPLVRSSVAEISL
jgi:hypothetical protein